MNWKSFASLILLTCLAMACSQTVQGQNPSPSLWQVKSVHDGDTIRVRQGNREYKIRFACVDSPELQQPLGRASRNYLRDLLANSGNQVRLNIVDTDRYGRKVAEVFTPDGQLIQEQQAKAGMTYLFERYLRNCPNGERVRQAQAIAQGQRLGIWARQYQTPWEYRKLAKH